MAHGTAYAQSPAFLTSKISQETARNPEQLNKLFSLQMLENTRVKTERNRDDKQKGLKKKLKREVVQNKTLIAAPFKVI